MSRVFDGNNANYLSFAGSLGVADPTTVLVYVKKAVAWSAEETFFNYAQASNKFLRCTANATGTARARGDQQFSAQQNTTGTIALDSWVPIVFYFSNGRPSLVLGAETTGEPNFFGTFASESSPFLNIGLNSTGASAPANCKLAQITVWSSKLSAADVVSLQGGADPSTIDSGNLIAHWPLADSSLVDTVGSKTLVVNGTVANDDADNPIATAGPTITGPGTAQEGVATSITGTDLNTVTETTLQDSAGTYSIVQSTVLNAGNLDVTPRRSVIAPTPGNPQPGIPVTPDITSPSVTTPWANRWRVTDE